MLTHRANLTFSHFLAVTGGDGVKRSRSKRGGVGQVLDYPQAGNGAPYRREAQIQGGSQESLGREFQVRERTGSIATGEPTETGG